MPFVEKNLDGFLTAENAESTEKRFTSEGHGFTQIQTEKILARITKTRRHKKRQNQPQTHADKHRRVQAFEGTRVALGDSQISTDKRQNHEEHEGHEEKRIAWNHNEEPPQSLISKLIIACGDSSFPPISSIGAPPCGGSERSYDVISTRLYHLKKYRHAQTEYKLQMSLKSLKSFSDDLRSLTSDICLFTLCSMPYALCLITPVSLFLNPQFAILSPPA